MESVPISKFKATCLALLDRVKRTGQTIIITRKGQPIAQVMPPPVPEKPESWLGCFQASGRIWGILWVPPSMQKSGRSFKGETPAGYAYMALEPPGTCQTDKTSGSRTGESRQRAVAFPISLWEVLILVEKRRVVLDLDAAAWIRRVLARVPFKEAPLNHEVALKSGSLSLAHQDPADRFLAATALVYDLTLVTADERLLHSKELHVLPNT